MLKYPDGVRIGRLSKEMGKPMGQICGVLLTAVKLGRAEKPHCGFYVLTQAGRDIAEGLASGVVTLQQFRQRKNIQKNYTVTQWMHRLVRNMKGPRRHPMSGIDAEYLVRLWHEQDGRCSISDLPMTTIDGTGYKIPTNASVDRIDCSRGYVPGNVRLVCSYVNIMRMDLEDDELAVLCKMIYKNLSKKKNHAEAVGT